MDITNGYSGLPPEKCEVDNHKYVNQASGLLRVKVGDSNYKWEISDWTDSLKIHVYMCDFMNEHLPTISAPSPLHPYLQWYSFNSLSSEGHFYGQVNQSVRYVHSCLELFILIKMSTSIRVRSQWVFNCLPNQNQGLV